MLICYNPELITYTFNCLIYNKSNKNQLLECENYVSVLISLQLFESNKNIQLFQNLATSKQQFNIITN